jgi:hypothetical protein
MEAQHYTHSSLFANYQNDDINYLYTIDEALSSGDKYFILLFKNAESESHYPQIAISSLPPSEEFDQYQIVLFRTKDEPADTKLKDKLQNRKLCSNYGWFEDENITGDVFYFNNAGTFCEVLLSLLPQKGFMIDDFTRISSSDADDLIHQSREWFKNDVEAYKQKLKKERLVD